MSPARWSSSAVATCAAPRIRRSAAFMILSLRFTETSSLDAGYMRPYRAARLDGDSHTSQDVCTCIGGGTGQDVHFDGQ